MNKQPKIQVGILSRERLEFSLEGRFISDDKTAFPAGNYKAKIEGKQVCIENDSGKKVCMDSLFFSADDNNSSFEIKSVTIGVNFHWEQNENQRFRGALKLIPENGNVRAINVILLEDYLKSVISSEMSSTASIALLKAHAVISRSWLLAQIEKTKSIQSGGGLYQTSFETDDEITRWYDREDHQNFDVCADDHCQRYQGITKIQSENALKAVEETAGEVLTLRQSYL